MGNLCGAPDGIVVDDDAPVKGEVEWLPNRRARHAQITAALQSFGDEEKKLDRAATGSAREVMRRRLLSEVVRAQAGPSGEGFILVLDALGKHILGSQLKMIDIMFPLESVCLVENLEKKRQTNPRSEAVYFIAPTANNIRILITDFSDNLQTGAKRRAQYGGVHLLFTSPVHPQGVELIKQCDRLWKRIISFREMNCDFFPMERNVINFGLTDALQQLYGKGMSDPDNSVSTQLYDDVASRLVSVCITLHELPYIRIAGDNDRTRRIRDKFAEKMNHFMRSNTNWWYHSAGSGSAIDERATLIIYDRREDPGAPLIHDFRYQAFIHDLLEHDIKEGMGQTSFEYVQDDNSGNELRMDLVDEDDFVWRALRHQHIIKAAEWLQKWSAELRNTEGFKIRTQHENGEITKMRDYALLMRTADQTDTLVRAWRRHQKIMGELTGEFASHNEAELLLADLSELEGQICTGVNTDASEVNERSVRTLLKETVERIEVSFEEKARLITLYLVNFGICTSPADIRSIFDACVPPLPESMARGVLSMLRLNVPINNLDVDPGHLRVWKASRKRQQTRAKEIQRTSTLLTRSVNPHLEDIVSGHIKRTLPADEYTWRDAAIYPPPPEDIAPEGAPEWYTAPASKSGAAATGAGRSLRQNRIQFRSHERNQSNIPDWGTSLNAGAAHKSVEAKASDVSVDVQLDDEVKYSGGRTIVMVLGGASFSELAAMYSLMAKHKQEIVVCTTDYLTPGRYMQKLCSMGKDASDRPSQLNSPSDASQ